MLSLLPIVLYLYLLLSVLELSLRARAAPQNYTIDDTAGDERTGAEPVYGISGKGTWNEASKDDPCPICLIIPDGRQMHGGTWHDSTRAPGDGAATITLKFVGSAISIFCALSGQVDDATADSHLTLSVDGALFDSFHWAPTPTDPKLIYNQSVLSAKGLEDKAHVAVVTSSPQVINGQTVGSVILFDYAVYTTENIARNGSTSSTTTSPASTSSNRSSNTLAIGLGLGLGLGLVVLVAAVTLLTILVRSRRGSRLPWKKDHSYQAPKTVNEDDGSRTQSLTSSTIHPYSKSLASHRIDSPTTTATGGASGKQATLASLRARDEKVERVTGPTNSSSTTQSPSAWSSTQDPAGEDTQAIREFYAAMRGAGLTVQSLFDRHRGPGDSTELPPDYHHQVDNT